MPRTIGLFFLSFVALVATAPVAWAQVIVRAPFVRVEVGSGVHVRAPFTNVQVSRSEPPLELPGGVPVGQPSQVEPVPTLPPPTPLVPPAPVVVRPITLREFAASFQPLPGNYEVVFAHTRTGCPVKVCFTLPPGCPKVLCSRHQIEFDYGKCEVEIRFQLFGRVKVEYDD
jgi:hypothetical protein